MEALPQEVVDCLICDSFLDRLASPPVRDGGEGAGDVARDDPLGNPPLSCESMTQGGDGVIGAPVGPESRGTVAKVSFPSRFQDHPEGVLDTPIDEGRDPSRSPRSVRRGDIHPTHRQWFQDFGLELFPELP
jgi:hypothetical protein